MSEPSDHGPGVLPPGQPKAIGTWSLDLRTGAIEWGPGLREILGLPDNAAASLDAFEALIHQLDRPLRRGAFEAALSGSQAADYFAEYRIVRPVDGRERWVTSCGKVVHVAGQPARIDGIVCDVTELRRASDSIRRSEMRLAGFLAIASDAIVSADSRQRITIFNQGAEQIFGYSRAEALGQPLSILLPERYRAAHADHVEQFGASSQQSRRMGQRGEIMARRKNGEEFPAEASISHLEIDGEQVYTVVLRDVSERKRTEDLLARSNAMLEARVEERTEALQAEMGRRESAQAQLLRTQRMEAFGQLTGGIAHDFNNLLTVITGNLELLEMRLTDERQLALLKRAYDAAGMGARLTSRLLTFARRGRFSTATLDLNEQVMGMVELLQRTLGEPIDLNARLEPRLWPVRADPSEIENAVLNLAINARDAMPKGGRLVIETANVTIAGGDPSNGSVKPGQYVRLSVADNGTGMAPDIANKAFEPFFTTKEHGKGTGLGLSTIYGFATQLGGAATIYSEVGHGTTVNVYLPRSEGGASARRGDEAVKAPPAAAGEVILLVEDNADVRHVTRARLEELGYAVIEAVNGPAAVEVLQSGVAVGAVLSDVVMPGGMSGLDVAEWVRRMRPGLDVMLMSGYPAEVVGRERPDAPSYILRKPFDRHELARALRQMLDARPRA